MEAIEIAGLIVVPILLMWWDIRRKNREDHQRLVVMVAELSIKMDPLWAWFTRVREIQKERAS